MLNLHDIGQLRTLVERGWRKFYTSEYFGAKNAKQHQLAKGYWELALKAVEVSDDSLKRISTQISKRGLVEIAGLRPALHKLTKDGRLLMRDCRDDSLIFFVLRGHELIRRSSLDDKLIGFLLIGGFWSDLDYFEVFDGGERVCLACFRHTKDGSTYCEKHSKRDSNSHWQKMRRQKRRKDRVPSDMLDFTQFGAPNLGKAKAGRSKIRTRDTADNLQHHRWHLHNERGFIHELFDCKPDSRKLLQKERRLYKELWALKRNYWEKFGMAHPWEWMQAKDSPPRMAERRALQDRISKIEHIYAKWSGEDRTVIDCSLEVLTDLKLFGTKTWGSTDVAIFYEIEANDRVTAIVEERKWMRHIPMTRNVGLYHPELPEDWRKRVNDWCDSYQRLPRSLTSAQSWTDVVSILRTEEALNDAYCLSEDFDLWEAKLQAEDAEEKVRKEFISADKRGLPRSPLRQKIAALRAIDNTLTKKAIADRLEYKPDAVYKCISRNHDLEKLFMES
jgi:hypothetical protein